MDNATHTLCALTLARAGLDRVDPRATATLVAAGSIPDLDIVVRLVGGQPAYLCHHRGITHAVLGLALETLLLAGLVWLWTRRRPLPSRFGPLALAAGVGFASHLALDALNTYGVRPWLPFDGRWYYGDVAFIVDPWLWLLLGAAAALGAPALAGERRPIWGWVLFTLLALEVMLLQDRATAGLIPLVWGAAMAGIVGLRRAGVGAPRRRAVAGGCLLAALVYLTGLGLASRAAAARAEERVQAGTTRPVEVVSCQPVPGRVHAFRTAVSTASRTWILQVDLLAGRVELEGELERGLDDPALARVAGTPEHDAWRCFARHPFVARAEGRLILGDARYTPEPRPSWCNFALPLPPDLAEAATPTSASAPRPSPSR